MLPVPGTDWRARGWPVSWAEAQPTGGSAVPGVILPAQFVFVIYPSVVPELPLLLLLVQVS